MTDPNTVALTREAHALSARIEALDPQSADPDTIITMLHDLNSTFGLLQDLPEPPGQPGPGFKFIGRFSAAQMLLTEMLATALERERRAGRERLRRLASDRNVLASLLAVAMLLDALLAIVALR